MKPLAIDLFCGLGGWAEGFLSEGYDVIGFDIERHRYPKTIRYSNGHVKRPGLDWSDRKKRGSREAQFNCPPEISPNGGYEEYPGQLVLQDVLTIHGSQFKNAAVIVASPPCQEFSYMAMPWSLAKEKIKRIESSPEERKRLTALFDSCFRIQREACEASGRYIPLIVENVRGAQKWVGRSRWHYGSYHLWGDVPALMPIASRSQKGVPHLPTGNWTNPSENGSKVAGFRFDGSGKSFQSAAVEGCKGKSLWFGDYQSQKIAQDATGLKQGGDWFGKAEACSMSRRFSSKSNARKAASAIIAKIPLPLARHIAKCFKEANHCLTCPEVYEGVKIKRL
jgi:hypothetical protein